MRALASTHQPGDLGRSQPADELLTEDDVPAYLVSRKLANTTANVTVAALGGGISNIVLLASWPGHCVVIKQSLPKLRVAADWEFDRARVLVEADCMSLLSTLLPGTCPSVLDVDEKRFAMAMTCAPSGGVVWKDAHMQADVRRERALGAGRLLARIQVATAGREDVAARFADTMPLFQGRIEPYHRAAAEVHPELAAAIEAEVERMLASRTVLVHGDFSPKNLIAYDGDEMFMLDFEVAHWGDAAFDPAFLMSLLITGSCYHPQIAEAFIDQARCFWAAYLNGAGAVAAAEPAVIAELGCLLLARVSGKSPVEYLTEDRQRAAVQRYAAVLLSCDAGTSLGDALDLAIPTLGLA